jgi:hypothetical protein
MNRVLLINSKKNPSRSELTTTERRTGELLFAQFPELQWAGFIIVENKNLKAANWIIPPESLDSFCEYAASIDPEGYELAIMSPQINGRGNQTSCRIL